MVYKVRNASRSTSAPTRGSARPRWALEYLLFKTGPLTMPPSQLGAFAKSDPSQPAREHRVARAAAVARQVRRSAAPVPRDHAVGLQPAADQRAATCASRVADPAAHPAIRSTTSRREEDRAVAVRGIALHAPHHGAHARWRSIAPRNGSPGPRCRDDAELRARRRRSRHDDLPSGRHLHDGPRPAWRSSTTGCACTASTGCA